MTTRTCKEEFSMQEADAIIFICLSWTLRSAQFGGTVVMVLFSEAQTINRTCQCPLGRGCPDSVRYPVVPSVRPTSRPKKHFAKRSWVSKAEPQVSVWPPWRDQLLYPDPPTDWVSSAPCVLGTGRVTHRLLLGESLPETWKDIYFFNLLHRKGMSCVLICRLNLALETFR